MCAYYKLKNVAVTPKYLIDITMITTTYYCLLKLLDTNFGTIKNDTQN